MVNVIELKLVVSPVITAPSIARSTLSRRVRGNSETAQTTNSTSASLAQTQLDTAPKNYNFQHINWGPKCWIWLALEFYLSMTSLVSERIASIEHIVWSLSPGNESELSVETHFWNVSNLDFYFHDGTWISCEQTSKSIMCGRRRNLTES